MDLLSHSWESKRIKHLFQERIEKNSDSKNDYLSIVKDVGVIPYSEKGNVGNKTSDNPENYKRVYPDDLVINPMNVTIGSVGISNHYGCLSNVYMVLKPKIKFHPQYYGYVFQIKSFQKSLRKISYGIMEIRESINKIEFFGLELPYPPLHEQQQIVSFLDTRTSLIDSLIEKTQLKIKLLKEKRTSLFNEIVTKGLNPNVEMKDSGVDWIGEIPSHWEMKKVSYLSKEMISGPFGSSLKKEFYTKSGYKIYGQEQVIKDDFSYGDYYISEEKFNELKRCEIKSGDILISCVGTFGKISMVPNEFEKGIINPRLLKVSPNDSILSEYFLKLLRSEISFIQFESLSRGGTMGVINLDILRQLKFPLPTISEQQQIVEYLDEQIQRIDKSISIEEKRTKLFKEYRQSLISEVVTGKRKVV